MVDVRDLTVVIARSAAEVVSEVSFAIEKGSILGLVGESGSGKTTMALALMNFARRGLKVSKGSVRFGGKDVLDISGRELQSLRGSEISYVAQDPSSALNPALRVRTQIEEVIEAHQGASDQAQVRDRVGELLAEVGLDKIPQVLDRFPHQLSGGQQQRVVLAMAFACKPRLIVLDEPTTGLDVTTQKLVLQTLRELCVSYDCSAVYISHDLAVVATVADHLAVAYAGQIVEFGDTPQVFSDPQHPYTRSLLSAIPSVRKRSLVVGLPGESPRPGSKPEGCYFAARCPSAEPACALTAPQTLMIADDDSRWVRCRRASEDGWSDTRSEERTSHLEVCGVRPDPPLSTVAEGREALTVAGLSASYGKREVIHDVSIEVTSGRCLAVVGESGSGKTTLAMCIAGLHREWTGDVLLNGTSIPHEARRRSKATLSAVQLVFQNPYAALNPRKQVSEIIGRPLRSLGIETGPGSRDLRVAEVMQECLIPEKLARSYPAELSGGERQRVAIARALVSRPSVLICDEITSALDVSVQATVVDLLLRLRDRQGLGILFVTHDLALVRSIADSVAVMRDGEVVENGSADSVFGSAADSYTRQLLADTPSVREA